MNSYYDILGVSKNASKEEITKVFKQLSIKYHPDRNKGEKRQSSEKKYKEISEAYSVIGDKNKRREYDMQQSGFGGGFRGGSGSPFGSGFNTGGFQSFGFDFGSIFNDLNMFGNNGFQRTSSRSAAPKVQIIEIDLEEAINGTTRQLRYSGIFSQNAITIEIPKGVHDGYEFSVEGSYQNGHRFKISIKPHSSFNLINGNLYQNIWINQEDIHTLKVGSNISYKDINGMTRVTTLSQDIKAFPSELRVANMGFPKEIGSHIRNDLILQMCLKIS